MPQVCLVVPCYNEERRLPGADLMEYLRRHPDVSLCLVDDGSSDGTRALLEGLREQCRDRMIVLELERNRGKAEAVRQGVLHVAAAGGFAIAGYWDADLSTPLDQLAPMLAVLEARPACQLVMGSRVKRLGSSIDRRAVRHYLGRIFSTFASLILDLPVYDSQCGAKVFRIAQSTPLFGEPFITRWLFDVELLARLRDTLGREAALHAVIELPLGAWREIGGSKLGLAHMVRVPLELMRIRSRYKYKQVR